MDTSLVFTIANTAVLPMWFLMIFLPKLGLTKWLIDTKLIPIILALLYGFYIIMAVESGDGMDFGSLESVMQMFTQVDAVMAGWIHYLVFDLLVGMWMLNKNASIGLHPIVIGICLLFTLMFGPIGFLIFMVCKALKRNN